MAVLRIVANLDSRDPGRSAMFYRDLLGLEVAMDHGWIRTYAGAAAQTVQVSVAAEGGGGLAVPALSIEVDDIDAVHARALSMGIAVERELALEPWGVRRFFVRDPDGYLVNILAHADAAGE